MYIRESQNKLLELSEHWSIISVTGPRQSGKTTLCKMAFPDQMLKMYKMLLYSYRFYIEFVREYNDLLNITT